MPRRYVGCQSKRLVAIGVTREFGDGAKGCSLRCPRRREAGGSGSAGQPRGNGLRSAGLCLPSPGHRRGSSVPTLPPSPSPAVPPHRLARDGAAAWAIGGMDGRGGIPLAGGSPWSFGAAATDGSPVWVALRPEAGPAHADGSGGGVCAATGRRGAGDGVGMAGVSGESPTMECVRSIVV
jgi:hypothetical protein